MTSYPSLSSGISSLTQSACTNLTLSGKALTSMGMTLRLPRRRTPTVSMSLCGWYVVTRPRGWGRKPNMRGRDKGK